MTKSTRDALKEIVAKTLPAGRGFEIVKERSSLGTSTVLRVITPAWKTLPKMDRILRMQDAILPALPQRERDKIFRISVLTPTEWKEIREDGSLRRKFKIVAHKKGSRPRAKTSTKSSPSPKTTKPAIS